MAWLPGSTTLSEEALVAGLRRGDPAAWQTLCATYGQPLYLYAYHRCGDLHGAEDIRQETLLAAVRSIATYHGAVPIFGWLCGIARHKAADAARRRKRQPAPVEIVADAWCHGAAGGPLLPEESVERAETRAAVVEALWSLPAQYREALVARYVHGIGVDEIARRLGRNYKAAESLLSRARESFRCHLREVEPHGPEQ